MKFDKYLNTFKDHLEERNFAERTVETYLYNTKRFWVSWKPTIRECSLWIR